MRALPRRRKELEVRAQFAVDIVGRGFTPAGGRVLRFRRNPMRIRRPYRRADVGIDPYNGMLRDRLRGKLVFHAQSAVENVGAIIDRPAVGCYDFAES